MSFNHRFAVVVAGLLAGAGHAANPKIKPDAAATGRVVPVDVVARRTFGRYDKNRDGVLDAKEFARAADEMRKQMSKAALDNLKKFRRAGQVKVRLSDDALFEEGSTPDAAGFGDGSAPDHDVDRIEFERLAGQEYQLAEVRWLETLLAASGQREDLELVRDATASGRTSQIGGVRVNKICT